MCSSCVGNVYREKRTPEYEACEMKENKDKIKESGQMAEKKDELILKI